MDTHSGSEPGPSGRLARHEVSYITLLSLTEIGVGSLVHAFRIPLGGHLLSLNQGLVLVQASRTIPPSDAGQLSRGRVARSASNIALVSAMLKSLSPAGKRLTPMLAISVQGLLFSLGVVIAGVGRLGLSLGMILSSLWAFAQPLLLAWLFVGARFWEALDSVWQKIAEPLGLGGLSPVGMLLVCAVLKASVAVSLVWISDRIGSRMSQRLAERGSDLLRRRALPKDSGVRKNSLRAAFRDLASPLVGVSLALSVLFAFYDGGDSVKLVWAALRPLSLAFVSFYFLRVVPTEKIVALLARRSPARAELIRRAKLSLEKVSEPGSEA
jgi:hypothetical protein